MLKKENHMAPKIMKFLCILVAVAFLFACGGEKGEVEEQTGKEASAEAPEMSPQELGMKIATVYASAMVEATDFLLDKPEPAEVKAAVETMKEDYIQKIFVLGQQREVMEEADKKACDTAVMMEFDSRTREDWYTTYSEICNHYFDKDLDFYDLVTSLNILGQYANFDLLQKQDPGEAERLGITIEE